MRITGLCMAAGTIAASTLLGAHQQALFRAETNFVEVNAIVTDKLGHFVPGLTAADFQVFEGNRAQDVSAFTTINLPTDPHGASASATAPLMVRPGAHDVIDGNRIYLLYLNSLGAPDLPLARQYMRQFVEDAMLPGDLVGVWDAGSTGRDVTFTNDRAEVLRAIDPFTGGGPTVTMTAAEKRGEEAGRLKQAIDWLSDIQGRRKSLIFFTAGWFNSGLDGGTRDREVSDWLNGNLKSISALGGGWFTPINITEHADVHIYACDVRGLVAPGTSTITEAHYLSSDVAEAAAQAGGDLGKLSDSAVGLRTISEATGGFALVDRNDYTDGFARIVADNSQYYLLGYYSLNRARDGRFHEVRVHVTRPDLVVRARNGYIAR